MVIFKYMCEWERSVLQHFYLSLWETSRNWGLFLIFCARRREANWVLCLLCVFLDHAGENFYACVSRCWLPHGVFLAGDSMYRMGRRGNLWGRCSLASVCIKEYPSKESIFLGVYVVGAMLRWEEWMGVGGCWLLKGCIAVVRVVFFVIGAVCIGVRILP
jgi:hypothetical protein